MRIGEYCNREVVIIKSDESVKAAAELMRTHHVGDLVIVEKQNNKQVPIGIITDRDLVIEVMAAGLAPEVLTVRDILTEQLNFVVENDSFFDALDLMRTKKVRRLPVVNHENSLVGIITMDDILDILAEMITQVASIIKLQQRKEIRQRT
ncbi:CBS domain-containing protein [Legionella micdadei]|uniref:CBS domain-containing protein n=1 Tax=Legionella micdadei TaxID=451 RepID=A0A098GHM8_LEGMI|nr:CBS domain-containing protein [Legionella micdadei]ARG96653.1 histidine kinase [Legionella micdadei]ARG99400.1 histidine kinase [Legionella micdadei]KTD26316.1 CBS domain protein [Legionella micdadei]NSL19108.1 CBS domain-containing protein [Legionella micdadei]CEG61974.1 conserved protein of unknown function with CBS domain [Legionella micdadei]